ncbi:MAG: 6-phosphogluconolactonase [Syntrophobacteraceae bacterium]
MMETVLDRSKISVYPDSESLIAGAADLIVESAEKAVKERGRFTLALSGGETPQPLYERLAAPGYRERIDWSKVLIFFGDERCVPPDDPRSNYLMAGNSLFDRAPIPRENIYRMHGEDQPEKAAGDYEKILRRTFGGDAGFDLILLGMGDNGHTASLFPGLAAVTEKERWVVAAYVEVAGMWRITMTPVVINSARRVVFLISGGKKAEILRRVLQGPFEPVVLPSQVVRPDSGELRFLLDRQAAAKLGLES